MTRLTSFTKYFGVGVTVGSVVAARHCYDVLAETSLEVTTILGRIDRTGKELASQPLHRPSLVPSQAEAAAVSNTR